MPLLHRFQAARIAVTNSLWFVPGLCVLSGIGLAIGLTSLDVAVGHDWTGRSTYLFGVGAEGARGMLSAIAGSMMTVASLTFSLTISTLATAASQYTSRLIRNFMRDRVNQFVLGFFVGLFGYCLVVLRSIRDTDEGAFVPSLAVFGGLALALLSIGVLVFFIHHIAESIQASVILQNVTSETIRAIEKLFPDKVAEPADGKAMVPDVAGDARTSWHPVGAKRMGYVQNIDTKTLLKSAEDRHTVVRMEADIGDFVTEQGILCSVAGLAPPDENTMNTLRGAFAVGGARTIEQDPAFGVRQIVDIALKALSPGVNDTTTGVMSVEHLGAIIEAISCRDVPDRFRAKDGTLRLIASGRSFEAIVRLSLDQIRQSAPGNVAALAALLRVIGHAARQTQDAGRRALLHEQARQVADVARKTVDYDADRKAVRLALVECLRHTAPLELTLPHAWLPLNEEIER